MKMTTNEANKLYLENGGQALPTSFLEFYSQLPEVRTSDACREMPVESSEDIYEMEKPQRGPCLIINNMKFSGVKQKSRPGSAFNAMQLKHVFEQFHFKVTLLHNQTAQEMQDSVRAYVVEEFENKELDAVVIIMLSHGCQGGIFGTDGRVLKYNDIMSMLDNRKCKHLRGKPKLCFFQACHGDLMPEVVPDNLDSFEQRKNVAYPQVSDVLMSFAAQEGFMTTRHYGIVGYYATHLASVLAEHAHNMHLLDMLVLVEKEMRKTISSVIEDNGDIWELCLSNSFKGLGWMKKLYFNPSNHIKGSPDSSKKDLFSCLPLVCEEPGVDEEIAAGDHRSGNACNSPENVFGKLKVERKQSVTDFNDAQMAETSNASVSPTNQNVGQRLWVLGGDKFPEYLSEDLSEWIIQNNTGLDNHHRPIPNSSKPVLVLNQYGISKWDPNTRKIRKVENLTAFATQSEYAYAHLDGRVYLMGGLVENQAHKFCRIFDVRSSSWEINKFELTRHMAQKPAVVFKGKIHLFTGKPDQTEKNLEWLDLNDYKWKEYKESKMNKGRNGKANYGYAVASCGTYIWFFGGCDGKTCLTDVDRFCPGTGNWEKKKSMNIPRMDLSVTYFAGKFYAIGGRKLGLNAQPLDVCEIYDPNTDDWIVGASLKQARSGHGSVVVPVPVLVPKGKRKQKTEPPTSSKMLKEEPTA